MIVVNMDLLSAISQDRNQHLARIVIFNDGRHSNPRRGNYGYCCLGKKGQLLKQGSIMDWPRAAKTPLALLQAVINDAYPKVKNERR